MVILVKSQPAKGLCMTFLLMAILLFSLVIYCTKINMDIFTFMIVQVGVNVLTICKLQVLLLINTLWLTVERCYLFALSCTSS